MVRDWLAGYVSERGQEVIGAHGYSSIGAVVGATFPEEAKKLRETMKNSFFLVPGYGTQGGSADGVVSCFNDDGLGVIINSSRGVLYQYLTSADYDGSRAMYMEIVRNQALLMKKTVYGALKRVHTKMQY